MLAAVPAGAPAQRLLRRDVLVLALALGALPSFPGASLGAERDATPVATTPHFAFHSDLATNVHDALVVAGAAREAGEPELFGSGAEAECLAGLAPSERLGWNLAVDFYAEVVAPDGWRGRPQFLVRLDLAGIEEGLDGRGRRFTGIARGFLAAATPAYEECRWSAQDAENRRWVQALEPRLATHGAAVARRLERYYGIPLHGLPIRVDVVPTAPWSGANTVYLTPAGGHVLISSANAERLALETVFHEASHTLVRRGDPVPKALAEAAAALDVELPRDLWHVVLFYTTGEAVRRTLEEAGEPGYTPYLYSYERFAQGEWGRYRAAIETTWPAYLSGDSTLPEAARALLETVAEQDGGRSGEP